MHALAINNQCTAPYLNQLLTLLTQLETPVKINDIIAERVLAEYEMNTANSAQIFKKLKQQGYELLGSGQDSTVWAKDEHQVIKIIMPARTTPGQISDADKGFMVFYQFCQDNKDLPNLPKFMNIGDQHYSLFELNGVQYRQVAMERLRPIASGSFEEAMVWILSDLVSSTKSWPDIVLYMQQPDTWDGAAGMEKMPELVAKNLANASVSKQYGILHLTMKRLFKAGRQAGVGWDLHTENVMQRGDGTLVIVDPYFT